MLILNKGQKEIQKAARDFAKGEFDKDLAYDLDKNERFPKEIWEKAGELGFIGMHFPEKYSGQGMAVLDNVLVVEEFCRKDSSIGSAIALCGYGSECLMRFADNVLKEALLPEVAEGRMLSGGAFIERGTGNDFTAIETTAIKDGEHWIINGQKAYVLNGETASFFILLARTDPKVKEPNGISMFLIERDREGITVKDLGEKLGLRMTSLTDLYFKDVRIPGSYLIGKQGQGVQLAQAFFNESRIVIAALSLGTAQGAFDRALDYVKQRVQFGEKIVQFQVTQHKLAEMGIKIDSARCLVYDAAWKFDQGIMDSKLTAMAKLVAGRAATEVSNEAVQLLGGYGYIKEYEVERYYRDAKSLEILLGNRNYLKDIIAKSLIGKVR